MRNVVPDATYERKIVEGRTTPTWDYVTTSEAHALLNGRYRGDGRRIDQFVLPEGPLGVPEDGWWLEPFDEDYRTKRTRLGNERTES